MGFAAADSRGSRVTAETSPECPGASDFAVAAFLGMEMDRAKWARMLRIN
jgi:hypothetical protein